LSYALAPPRSKTVLQRATLQYVAYYSEAKRHTHLQLVDGKFLISGYGLISLEAQRLTPFLSLSVTRLWCRTPQEIHFCL
jgi:hypothetical protein